MQLKEYSKREAALDDKNISFVLSQKCKESRNDDYRSYKCRGNCADNFASISDAFKAVKIFACQSGFTRRLWILTFQQIMPVELMIEKQHF